MLSGSHLLAAAGRVPNTDGLNLDAAGIQTDERGFIPVNGMNNLFMTLDE